MSTQADNGIVGVAGSIPVGSTTRFLQETMGFLSFFKDSTLNQATAGRLSLSTPQHFRCDFAALFRIIRTGENLSR